MPASPARKVAEENSTMIRLLLTSIVRMSEWRPSILAGFAAFSLVVGFLRAELAPAMGEEVARYVARFAFAVSFLAFLPIVIRDWSIWRLFAPRYRGLDEYLQRIDPASALGTNAFLGKDGRLRIDAAKFLEASSELMERMWFVGDDQELCRIAAEINATAFSGSRYGLSFDNKLRRNTAISSRHPLTFCLIEDHARTGVPTGLASTIPLSVTGTQTYVTGQVSDNNFNADMVAAPGEPIGSAVFFLIARYREAKASGGLESRIFEELVQASVVQLVLIALAAGRQESIHAIAANSSRKMVTLFERLHLSERKDFKSADQERMFNVHIRLSNLRAASALIEARFPALAKLTRQEGAPALSRA